MTVTSSLVGDNLRGQAQGVTMLFKRIYDDDLAQASYLVGCQERRIALVVDPRRDIAVYLREARRQDMEIVGVVETHIHADYLSGARELAAATGATLYLSDEGTDEWQYGFEHEGLYHGSEIFLGKVRLRALHTPGHTPEHLTLVVTDGTVGSEPVLVLTGDFVFVGDVGRPDLLDEAGGAEDTRVPLARALFTSLETEFIGLAEHLQVWPGHGAGSACGKALGALDSTTVGYEKLVAWWSSYTARGDIDGFTAELLSGQPDAPRYFGRMKRWNRDGPQLLGLLPEPRRLTGQDVSARVQAGALLVDTRPREVFDRSHLPGAINIPASTKFVTYAAWVLDPESEQREIILTASDTAGAAELRDRLARIGVDDVVGYTSEFGALTGESTPLVSPERLWQLGTPFILDIRSRSEFEAGHIPGSVRIHGGRLMGELDRLPREDALVVHCQSGSRSAVVGSALRAKGFDNVVELEGSFEGWRRARPDSVEAG